MSSMKLIGMICVTAVCTVGLGAQTRETETKSKVTVKDGKSVTVTGCVAPAVVGKGFVLTNVADKTGNLHDYVLVSDDDELSKHVGHRVQLSGKVTDRGDAKVKIESKSKTKVEHGDDKETRSESEIHGDVKGTPYLGVKDIKMIAAVCP
jgi:hypothetical protein